MTVIMKHLKLKKNYNDVNFFIGILHNIPNIHDYSVYCKQSLQNNATI